jgi:excisionase family DNA binding protein
MRSHEPISEPVPNGSTDLTELDLPVPRAYRIPDVCKLTGLGRTTIYAAIKAGALIARRYGRCTIVLAEDLAAFLRNLPTSR